MRLWRWRKSSLLKKFIGLKIIKLVLEKQSGLAGSLVKPDSDLNFCPVPGPGLSKMAGIPESGPGKSGETLIFTWRMQWGVGTAFQRKMSHQTEKPQVDIIFSIISVYFDPYLTISVYLNQKWSQKMLQFTLFLVTLLNFTTIFKYENKLNNLRKRTSKEKGDFTFLIR